MALLDANMGLLTESLNLSPSQPGFSKPVEYSSIEKRESLAHDQPEQLSYLDTHFAPGGEFASSGQFSFNSSYYPSQHSTSTSPATYSTGNIDVQSQEFGFGMGGDPGLWSY